ncbi:hypothetical protein BDB01DRAFT_832616 [Pilobolus umbonatus]|nr:hypothetical protein BDB01DRAFT_832616 [Pilobolus umbonatus]
MVCTQNSVMISEKWDHLILRSESNDRRYLIPKELKMIEELFPVNSGDVQPPSQSGNSLPHQMNQIQPMRRKHKDITRSTNKLQLERILGLTSTSSNTLAVSETKDLIAYAAGAVIVIYNHKRNKQIAFLFPPPILTTTSNNTNNQISSPIVQSLNQNDISASTIPPNVAEEKKANNARAKPISCLAFSPDGNYLAAGEMGHQPRIMIWNIKEQKLLREFKSHKFGVLSISFSPNMRYLVSIGFQHDGYLYVWDWKKGAKLAGNKVTSRVNAVSFSKDGSYFVTAGLRHVKFWYLDAGRIPKKRTLSRETQVLDGRSGILGVLRDANFVDVACDRSSDTGYTYFITDNGILCIFKAGRVIDKWVDLQVKSAYSIAVSATYVVCTCSEGIIRLFEPVTLKYLGILPKPHPLGMDISSISSPDMIRSTDKTFYPDVVAMVYDDRAQRVISVYSDRSLYLWDIKDLNKIGKYRSFIFHSDCVWGVESCPDMTGMEDISTIPANSFTTFSSDGTIRIWNIDSPLTLSSTSSSPLTPPIGIMTPSSSTAVSMPRRNIYSRELVKMLYVDPDAAKSAQLREEYECEDQCNDFGIRSLKMSPDGKIMASGDRSGNLRVHNMKTWELLNYQEAHDSEILSIDIATPIKTGLPKLIATGSRDRLLHIFDIKSNFQLVQSMDDHSSSITAVRFSEDGSKLISCGADKGLIFRSRTHPVTPFHDATPRPFTTYHNHSGRSTVFDMALDVNSKYVATVTGERRLFVFDVENGKPFRVCKPETAEELTKGYENSGGSLMTVDLDPYSGSYAVTSGSDRCIRLFDLTNNTCIEKVHAHSELITAVKFIKAHSGEHGLRVISTCSDGTIFIWKLNKETIAKMTARAGDTKLKSHRKVMTEEERKQMLLGIVQQQQLQSNKRIRRLSSASSFRPTASISQMIRQGDRRTFSTMSSAEQKYDDVYKKPNSTGRRNRIDTGATDFLHTHGHNREVHPYQAYEVPSPVDLNSNDIVHLKPIERPNRPLLVRRDHRQPPQETPKTELNSPPKRTGKLDRLYNGLPTNGRERTISQVSSSNAPFMQYRQNPEFLSFPQSNPALMGRTNPVLRRAISRDALRKDPDPRLLQRKSPTMLSPPSSKREVNGIPRRKSQPQFIGRRTSDISTDSTQSSAVEVDKNEETVKSESDDDLECEATREEEEEGEDDDDDEEEEIIFTPEREQTCIPFEVSTHHLDDEYEDGRMTPVSDVENNEQTPSTEEEEDASSEDTSEDNVEDVIIRTITAREPPRVSISLSRTTSLRRRNSRFDKFPEDELETTTPDKKKTANRQSITARFLSSLGASLQKIESIPKPALDHVIAKFNEIRGPGKEEKWLEVTEAEDALMSIMEESLSNETRAIEEAENAVERNDYNNAIEKTKQNNVTEKTKQNNVTEKTEHNEVTEKIKLNNVTEKTKQNNEKKDHGSHSVDSETTETLDFRQIGLLDRKDSTNSEDSILSSDTFHTSLDEDDMDAFYDSHTHPLESKEDLSMKTTPTSDVKAADQTHRPVIKSENQSKEGVQRDQVDTPNEPILTLSNEAPVLIPSEYKLKESIQPIHPSPHSIEDDIQPTPQPPETSSSTQPSPSTSSEPLQPLNSTSDDIATVPLDSAPSDLRSPMVTQLQSNQSSNPIPSTECEIPDTHNKCLINNQSEEENSRIEMALSDLDGIDILIESVLDTYLSIPKTSPHANQLTIIENKLNNVVDKVTKITQKETSPETIQLLERYSSLLMSMVQSKINS